MNVEQKPFMRTHGDGKPYFSWKIRGTNRPTQLYKCLISHIAQHFIAHDRDATYIPSNQENAHLSRTFARWLGDVYANVDEMHWRAIEQQIKWLFTKQDLFAVSSRQKHCIQLHFIGKNMLEELLK